MARLSMQQVVFTADRQEKVRVLPWQVHSNLLRAVCIAFASQQHHSTTLTSTEYLASHAVSPCSFATNTDSLPWRPPKPPVWCLVGQGHPLIGSAASTHWPGLSSSTAQSVANLVSLCSDGSKACLLICSVSSANLSNMCA